MAYWGYYPPGGPAYGQYMGPAGYPQPHRPVAPPTVRARPPIPGRPAPNPKRTTRTSKPSQSARGDDPFLRQLFVQVDTDRSGEIDAYELQRALSNGTWIPFNMDTVHMMIGMFDKDGSGGISFDEFGALWKFITDWQATFRRFDKDNSGNIDQEELKKALSTFGYRLSDLFYNLLMARFDRSRTGRLNFDDFIQLCLVLQTVTASFREKDKRRKGAITVTYEEFLSMVVTFISK